MSLTLKRIVTVKTFLFVTVLFAVLFIVSVVWPPKLLAYNGARLIDNAIFRDTNSMTRSEIQSFLERMNSGLKDKSFKLDCYGTGSTERQWYTAAGAPCDKVVPASHIIYYAGRIYGVNPQAIMATLQKEQSLITTTNPTSWQLNKAMGYGCPTSGSCDSTTGFYYQIDYGTWVLRYHYERANGNYTWWNNNTNWTCGTEKNFYKPHLYPNTNVTFYDGNNVAYRTYKLTNAATSALYCYTPHAYNNPDGLYGLPQYGTKGMYYTGSYNFVKFFKIWFGNPAIACTGSSNLSGIPSGPRVIDYNYGSLSRSYLTFTKMNNTGSTCTEAHVWEPGFTSWFTNIATGMDVTNPNSGRLIAFRSSIDSKDSLTYIQYSGAGGRTEVHRLSPNLQILPGYYDVSTNLSGVTATSGTFVAADFFGRGYDQLAYILFSGAGGRAEVHMFDPSLRTAVGYYDIATDLAGVTATSGTFVAGDFLGRGYGQLAYVTYGSTTVHLLDIRNGNATRIYEVPTNLQQTSAAAGTFVAGDFLGRSYGQLVYVIYNNSINRVETHMFNPSLTQATGFQDIITNLGGFDPDN